MNPGAVPMQPTGAAVANGILPQKALKYVFEYFKAFETLKDIKDFADLKIFNLLYILNL